VTVAQIFTHAFTFFDVFGVVLGVRGGVGVLAAKDGRRVVITAENATASRVNQMRVSPSRRRIIR